MAIAMHNYMINNYKHYLTISSIVIKPLSCPIKIIKLMFNRYEQHISERVIPGTPKSTDFYGVAAPLIRRPQSASSSNLDKCSASSFLHLGSSWNSLGFMNLHVLDWVFIGYFFRVFAGYKHRVLIGYWSASNWNRANIYLGYQGLESRWNNRMVALMVHGFLVSCMASCFQVVKQTLPPLGLIRSAVEFNILNILCQHIFRWCRRVLCSYMVNPFGRKKTVHTTVHSTVHTRLNNPYHM